MKEQYNVTYYITGPDYSRDDRAITTDAFDAVIEFECDPDQYGNGYYMGIRSRAEAFGFQSYDIRYDKTFLSTPRIVWLAQFFANRYDGKDGRWELTGIYIHDVEEQEAQDV